MPQLEKIPADRLTDETVYSYHYMLECVRWVEDCENMEQPDDGSCPVGGTCHGDWGPCECGCNQLLAASDDCCCVLCDKRIVA